MTTGNKQLRWNVRLVYTNWWGGESEFGAYRDIIWDGPNSTPVSLKVHNWYQKSITNWAVEPAMWFSGITWTSSPLKDFPISADGYTNLQEPDVYAMWSKMAEEVNGHKLNAAVAFGEMNKTLSHLGETASRIVRAASALRRGNVIAALKEAGYRRIAKTQNFKSRRTGHVYQRVRNRESFSPESLWLEYKYAWIPLYSDVYETFRAVHATLNKPRQVTYECRIKKRGKATTSTLPMYQNESYKLRKLTLMGDDGWKPVDAKGLENPELIAWELVPFSFVWDWFQPIGDWLTARGFLRGLAGWSYYHTKRYGYTWKMNCYKAYGNQGKVIINPTQVTHWATYMYHRRDAITTITAHSWSWMKIPEFELPGTSNMTLARCATSLALITPTLRKLLDTAGEPVVRTLRR